LSESFSEVSIPEGLIVIYYLFQVRFRVAGHLSASVAVKHSEKSLLLVSADEAQVSDVRIFLQPNINTRQSTSNQLL